MTLRELLAVAIVVPVASLAAVRVARRLGGWLEKAITRTFAETVRDVVAPDLARLGNRLGQAVDELRIQNSREHKSTSTRLHAVADELEGIQERLGALEDSLLRPHDARTRSTDQEEEEQQ